MMYLQQKFPYFHGFFRGKMCLKKSTLTFSTLQSAPNAISKMAAAISPLCFFHRVSTVLKMTFRQFEKATVGGFLVLEKFYGGKIEEFSDKHPTQAREKLGKF